MKEIAYRMEHLTSSLAPRHGTDGRTTQLLRDRGHGDHAIPVPTEWTDELGWRDGRLLILHRLPGARLMVSEENSDSPVPPFVLDLPAAIPPEHLFRQLVSAYLSGTDEITVRSASHFTAEQLAAIHEFSRRMPDLRVTFQTKQRFVLQGTPQRPGFSPRALISDMARRVVRLLETAGQSWDRKENGVRSAPFGSLDDEIDQGAWQMERTLVRELALGLYTDRNRAQAATGVNYLMAAKTLERIADHAVRIGEEGRKLAKGPPELRASLATVHEQVMRLLRSAVDLLDQPEEGAANALIDAADRLLSGREAFGRATLQFSRGWASRGSLVRPTDLVLESMRRSASYVADLGEIALDLLANS